MRITRCDICLKKISWENKIEIGYKSIMPQFSVCESCGKPVVAFLKKHKLIEKDKK